MITITNLMRPGRGSHHQPAEQDRLALFHYIFEILDTLCKKLFNNSFELYIK